MMLREPNTHWCLTCSSQLANDDPSLGGHEPEMCRACYSSLRAFERAVLHILADVRDEIKTSVGLESGNVDFTAVTEAAIKYLGRRRS